MLDRAAQFSPFAALTGYDDSVKEAARLTDVQVSLSEYEMEKLNAKLQILQEHIREQPEISVEYFQKDEKKDGGAYLEHTGRLLKIRTFERTFVFSDGFELPMLDICDISGEVFRGYDIG